MNNMQQRIYRPPNVAGWEGGMSWLNTNTVQGRFDMVTRAQYLKYSNCYDLVPVTTPPGRHRREDAAGRVRARVRVGRASRGCRQARATGRGCTRSALGDRGERRRGAADGRMRRARFYAVQAMILGGPDGQVM